MSHVKQTWPPRQPSPPPLSPVGLGLRSGYQSEGYARERHPPAAYYPSPGISSARDLSASLPFAPSVYAALRALATPFSPKQAAIADAQPPTPSVRPQMIPQPMMQQQGGPFGQQVSAFPPRPAMQFNTPQIYEQRPQHQPQLMPFPGHMSLRPGVINGLHSMHAAQISQGGRSDLPPGSAMSELPRGSTPSSSSMEGQVSKLDTRKQTVADSATTSVADGQRSSATEHGVGEVAEAPTYQKRSEDSKTS